MAGEVVNAVPLTIGQNCLNCFPLLPSRHVLIIATVLALRQDFRYSFLMTDCDPVGITEIAQRLGVQRATVDVWRARGVLPEPRWTVGGRPAWNWPDVHAWASERKARRNDAV